MSPHTSLMEYAAVFLLFVLTASAAFRLLYTGKGAGKTAFAVALFAAFCAEGSGIFGSALPSVFLAASGAAYLGYKKDMPALTATLTVAVIAVCAAESSYAGTAKEDWGYFCAAALCAVACNPQSSVFAFSLGYVIGDAYSVLGDSGTVLRYDAFSVKIAYFALFCFVASAFLSKAFALIEKERSKEKYVEGKRLFD